MKSIKDLREDYGLSRNEFCEVLKIPYRTVQSWELGVRSCPDYVFNMIDICLGVLPLPVQKPVETVENSGYNEKC